MDLNELLQDFATKNRMMSKGGLSVAIVITRKAKEAGLPLNAEQLLTNRGGQVKGLGPGAVQSILNEYGVHRVLAKEGGRTSRGSIGNMRKYVEFLNGLYDLGQADLDWIESWWIKRVNEYFSAKPFVLHFDVSKSLRAIIGDLLNQAEKRQKQAPGSTFAGAMLQHLVGAKLNIILDSPIEHRAASAADESSAEEGDFVIEDVVIHVTTFPTDALIRKCESNIASSYRPLIITTKKGVRLAEDIAEHSNINERIDYFEIEQFLASNIYEKGKFIQIGHKTTAKQLIEEYNKIIDECETDPSLKIELSK